METLTSGEHAESPGAFPFDAVGVWLDGYSRVWLAHVSNAPCAASGWDPAVSSAGCCIGTCLVCKNKVNSAQWFNPVPFHFASPACSYEKPKFF